MRQILYSLRRALDTETINDISGYSKNTFSEKIKNWNTKKDILIFINDNYRDIISEFNFLINQSYINFNSFKGFNKLNILVRKKHFGRFFL